MANKNQSLEQRAPARFVVRFDLRRGEAQCLSRIVILLDSLQGLIRPITEPLRSIHLFLCRRKIVPEHRSSSSSLQCQDAASPLYSRLFGGRRGTRHPKALRVRPRFHGPRVFQEREQFDREELACEALAPRWFFSPVAPDQRRWRAAPRPDHRAHPVESLHERLHIGC